MPDADLEAGLDEAKKKPRYFAVITKGQTIVKMIVQKKPIKEGDIASAKRDFKGNGSVTGICTRSGAQMVLQVQGEEPTLKPIKIKEYISEETGATVKPEWQIVTELAEIPDSEDQKSNSSVESTKPGEKAADSEKPPSEGIVGATDEQKKTPTDSQATPPPDDSKFEAIRAALKETKGKIQQALVAGPQHKDQILGLVGTVKGHLDNKNELAMSSFRELVALLATVLQSRPAEVKETQPEVQTEDRRAHFEKIIQSITDTVSQFPADHPRKGDLTTAILSIEKQAKSDVEKAITLATGLLKWAAEELAKTAETGKFDALKTRLEPEMLKAQKANPDAATALGNIWNHAVEQADAGNDDKAAAAFERLEKAIADALAKAPQTDVERFGTTAGLVAGRRKELEKFFAARFATAEASTEGLVSSVEQAITEKVPDENPKYLAAAVQSAIDEKYEKVRAELEKPLADEGTTAAEIVAVVEKLRAEVASDELLAVLKRAKSELGVEADVSADFDSLFNDVLDKVNMKAAA
jgi:hypothetical protein